MTLDDAWMSGAACRGSDVDFHPDDPGPASANAAREVCKTCPVMDDCLHYAIAHHERTGIWGAMTTYERGQIPRHIRLSIEEEWFRQHPQSRRA